MTRSAQAPSRRRMIAALICALTGAAGASALLATEADAVSLPWVTNLRVGTHPGFDRAVIELTGRAATVRTRWVNKAEQCGSGHTVHVPGKRFLQVIVEPAQAHDDAGRNTYRGPGRTASVRYSLPNLKGLRLVCDFEGQVGWVFGVDRRTNVTVGKLSGPHRVYVDIKH